MEPPESPGAPPPYSPPAYPDLPPYTPDDANKQHTQPVGAPGAAHYATYGTPQEPPKPGYEQNPPGAPPYSAMDPNPQPISTSTTLLVSRERKPPTFFLLSIITCLCFSPLFGIIAIIFSALSDSAWSGGDTRAAKRYSQVAVALSIVGILVTVFTIILIFTTGAIRLQPLHK